jgi:ankyrin repeat protein
VLYEVGLDTEIIKQIISVKDNDGWTVLHTAASDNEDEGVLLELLKFIIENYRNPEGTLCYVIH